MGIVHISLTEQGFLIKYKLEEVVSYLLTTGLNLLESLLKILLVKNFTF